MTLCKQTLKAGRPQFQFAARKLENRQLYPVNGSIRLTPTLWRRIKRCTVATPSKAPATTLCCGRLRIARIRPVTKSKRYLICSFCNGIRPDPHWHGQYAQCASGDSQPSQARPRPLQESVHDATPHVADLFGFTRWNIHRSDPSHSPQADFRLH
jgi:hypothetical protein